MTGILDSVNQRTQLVGQNRLELLTFRLMGRQRYGINVFKVKEVLQEAKPQPTPQQGGLMSKTPAPTPEPQTEEVA